MGEFDGKTILVTGASSGIGRQCAIAIAKEGGRLIMVSRDEQKLLETLSLCENRDPHLLYSVDLMQNQNIPEVFKKLKREGVVLDGMIHCAGITKISPLRTFNVEHAKELMDIHYFAFLELVKQYAKKGVSAGGSIVAISSINVHVPQKCMTAYASAKAAVEAACKTLSLELIEKSIRINSVVMGGVDTKMSQETGQLLVNVASDYENPVARQLMPVAKPEQVTGPILFLLSDKSSYITGRKLYVDGGLLG